MPEHRLGKGHSKVGLFSKSPPVFQNIAGQTMLSMELVELVNQLPAVSKSSLSCSFQQGMMLPGSKVFTMWPLMISYSLSSWLWTTASLESVHRFPSFCCRSTIKGPNMPTSQGQGGLQGKRCNGALCKTMVCMDRLRFQATGNLFADSIM